MKKNITLLLLISFAAMCFAYSKPQTNTVPEVKKTGVITMYGNEPFPFPGLDCENGEQYSIKAEKDVLDTLRKTQGKKIEITGYIEKTKNDNNSISFEELKDGYLIVKEWKYVK